MEEEKRTYTYTYSARRHAQKYHFNIIGLLLCHFNLHSFRFAQAQIGNETASFVPSFTLFLCYTLLMQVHYRARRRK